MSEVMKCRECEVEKPKTEYYKNRRKCKKCVNSRVKKWRNDNKDLHNDYCKTWRDKNNETFNEYMRNYKKKNYNPEKQHIYYMRHHWGKNTPVITC